MRKEFENLVEAIFDMEKALLDNHFKLTNPMLSDLYQYFLRSESKAPEVVEEEMDRLLNKIEFVTRFITRNGLRPEFSYFIRDHKYPSKYSIDNSGALCENNVELLTIDEIFEEYPITKSKSSLRRGILAAEKADRIRRASVKAPYRYYRSEIELVLRNEGLVSKDFLMNSA